MEKIDITIIGAGVIGLAIGNEVSKNRDVCIIEKNKTFGEETSSRNSEVIHSGIYYPKGSMKAIMCVEGKEMLYRLCKREGMPHRKIGKLIVATNSIEEKALEKLLKNGQENGVFDLRIISKQEIKQIEPHIEAVSALFSPSTGIIDSHSLMGYLAKRAEANGAIIAYNSRVVGIEKKGGEYILTIEEPNGRFSFKSKIVINSSGLNSDKIAKLLGIDIIKSGYKLNFCKGEYFWVKGSKNLVQRLIYPVPEDNGLGIHITLDLQGRMRLGPNSRYVKEIDYSVDLEQKRVFYEKVVRFFPSLNYDDIMPDMAGIRPKLNGPDEGFRDFLIKDERDKGFEGFINLIGIESPGLTASLSIAKYVGNIVEEIY